MAKQFSADEMREISYAFEPRGVVARIDNGNGEREILARDIVAILRRAADLTEQDEREKRYEYSIKNPNGGIMKTHEDEMFPIMPLICKVVRREIGEWEEVPNG